MKRKCFYVKYDGQYSFIFKASEEEIMNAHKGSGEVHYMGFIQAKQALVDFARDEARSWKECASTWKQLREGDIDWG